MTRTLALWLIVLVSQTGCYLSTGADEDEPDAGGSDTEIDTSCDPSYTYPANCIGDECANGSVCCGGTVCNEPVFDDDPFHDYMTHYCYPNPKKQTEAGVFPCECDDVAVSLPTGGEGDQTWTACLATGKQKTLEPVFFKILSQEYLDSTGGALGGADASEFEASTILDGEEILFDVGIGQKAKRDTDRDGVEDEEVYIFQASDLGVSESRTWMMIIPAERWAVGTLDSPWYHSSNGTVETNYSSYLMHMTVVGSIVDKIWVEGMAVDGTVTIEEVGEVCDHGGGCPKAKISLDLDLVAIKAQVYMGLGP
ncbi:MAG: hypothetical protein GY854_09035 [Deltaproteobacteria bacterium]|nr:hypothetical protein [Deltaproteobacteria bacterium]